MMSPHPSQEQEEEMEEEEAEPEPEGTGDEEEGRGDVASGGGCDEISQDSFLTPSAGSDSTQLLDVTPSSPPPPYEHVLAEFRLEAKIKENEENEKKKTDSEEEKAVPKGKTIVYKSSKELYRAIAAQWGITCKMSDRCRCLDCQSHYFDCEYDRENEQEKTDGGLGAGTPMFISEVMQGTACNIL